MTKSDAKRLHRESSRHWQVFVVDLCLAGWITVNQLLHWK